MFSPEVLTIAAVLLCALAVLPGSLGVLMLTNRIASDSRGARLIYQYSLAILVLSAVLLVAGLWQAAAGAGFSAITIAATILYTALCVFGFLMHTRFMFRPVREPRFIPVDEALEQFGPDEEVVGVVDPRQAPRAYVARLARRPHIVYQPEGDPPYLMTHCILSHSSMAYEMAGELEKPDILITAALANNMVFYEKNSKCSVIQIQNRARERESSLATVPTLMMRLGTWKKLFPDSQVWVRDKEWRDTFYLNVLARADIIDPSSPTLVYPLMHGRDERLPLKSLVLGVEIAGDSRAYPVSLFESRDLIHDELGGTPLVLVSAFDDDYLQVFSRELAAGRTLTFTRESQEALKDEQTGSVWNLIGRCVSGELEGRQLAPVPHYNKIFWFTWADYHPETEIHDEAGSGEDAASRGAAGETSTAPAASA